MLVAADHVLDPISPTVGLWPRSRPDPLGDYLAALEVTIALDARVALPGHGEPIADPGGRARALIAHHAERLAATADALGREPRSGYEVSFPLFGDDLRPAARRFAVAETLSHLERLVAEGGAPASRGQRRRRLYFRGVVDDELPPSTGAREGARAHISFAQGFATTGGACRR